MDSDALKFYEVVDGEVVIKSPPGVRESSLISLILGLVGPFARTRGLGRVVAFTLFWIEQAPNLMRRTDLAVVSAARWPLRRRVPQTEAWDVVPDLAVEVVSESNTANSVVIKIEEYFQAGARSVWVVYPVVKKIYIYNSPALVRILQPGGDLDGEDLLPGFRVALSTVFEEGDEEPGAAPAGDVPDVPRGD